MTSRTMRLLRNSTLAAASALLGACGAATCTGASGETEREPQTTTLEDPGPTLLALHMELRYSNVLEIREALVNADLGDARTFARGLTAPLRLDALPAEARSHVVRVPVHAQELADATQLDDAAAAFATLMNVCADCHSDADVELSFDVPEAPRGDDPDARMALHSYAFDRMWDGLLMGSDAAFDAGARLLRDAPLRLEGREPRAPEDVEALEARMRRIAEESSSAPNMADRSALFGKAIASCAPCHSLTRD